MSSRYHIPVDHELKPAHIRDIRPHVLGPTGRFKILPAKFWEGVSANERALFGHYTGIYQFPTVELVERLREIIAGRTAIEIGSGNGVLAEALGIPATDSFQQDNPKYREIYRDIKQATVPYGANVEKLAAYDAVRKYDPQVVLACWVTHKFNKNEPWSKGNEVGVDEVDVLAHCEDYVFVGNMNPKAEHTKKPIWRLAHEMAQPPFLFSRSKERDREFIGRWTGGKPRC